MCQECGWENFAARISELCDTYYDWAWDTLDGIRTWVLANEHCTFAQKEAVENISKHPEEDWEEDLDLVDWYGSSFYD